MNEDDNIRIVKIETDEQMKDLARIQLNCHADIYPISYDTFYYDFTNYYNKEQVMYEYKLIKDLEKEYGHTQTYKNWIKALVDVMSFRGNSI